MKLSDRLSVVDSTVAIDRLLSSQGDCFPSPALHDKGIWDSHRKRIAIDTANNAMTLGLDAYAIERSDHKTGVERMPVWMLAHYE